ncbi:MAG: indole-3-glycerol-phosphate synthase, partial [Saprospiraceae bacterium]|nr:indole-3-glycerol-phosphate synthase [Saprospiraceae bacterium]
MKNILEQIISDKRSEVDSAKLQRPVQLLEQSKYFDRSCISLRASLLKEDLAIISEIKRASPSAGTINEMDDMSHIMLSYVANGAAGLSILTDQKYFQGTAGDILYYRDLHDKPILRKDFIIDAYQIIEAKSIGADCILLIAAALEAQALKDLAKFARSLGLETLLEVKERSEIDPYISEDISIIGVNN